MVILFAPPTGKWWAGPTPDPLLVFEPVTIRQMTPDDFRALPDHEQERIIFTEGKFVDSVVKEYCIFALYAIHSFFVELEYDTISYSISSKNVFSSGSQLDKYLDWRH